MPDLVVSDLAALAIAESIDTLNFNIGTLIAAQNATLVAMLAAQQASAINMGGCWEKLADIEIRMRKADVRMEVMQTGLASISNKMADAATTAQMAYLDQVKNNEFQQQTTNASLARGGHPPTVVQPADLLTKLQKNIQEVTILKGEVAATNLVSGFISDGISKAWTTSYQWVATSAVGTFLSAQFLVLETKVAYVFSKEFIKDAIDFSERQVQKIKAGGV
jgi:hypothetical protein